MDRGAAEMSGFGEAFDLARFIDAVAAPDPLPAGGAVAALVGALTAALAEFGAGRSARGESSAASELRELARRARAWREALLRAIDEDVSAYQAYLAAQRLPRETANERRQRTSALQQARLAAALAPLRVARLVDEILDALSIVATRGNPSLLGDVAMAALLAEAASRGSTLNARLNLRRYPDSARRAELLARADELDRSAAAKRDALLARVAG